MTLVEKIKEGLSRIESLETARIELSTDCFGKYFTFIQLNNTKYCMTFKKPTPFFSELERIEKLLKDDNEAAQQFLFNSNLKLKDITKIEELVENCNDSPWDNIIFNYKRDSHK